VDRKLVIYALLEYFEQRAMVMAQEQVIQDFEERSDIILPLRI